MWYGMDDTYTTCFTPFYYGIDSLPKTFTGGSITKFSWDSAWWVFNIVSNYSYLKYSQMTPEIRQFKRHRVELAGITAGRGEDRGRVVEIVAGASDTISPILRHARQQTLRPLARIGRASRSRSITMVTCATRRATIPTWAIPGMAGRVVRERPEQFRFRWRRRR